MRQNRILTSSLILPSVPAFFLPPEATAVGDDDGEDLARVFTARARRAPLQTDVCGVPPGCEFQTNADQVGVTGSGWARFGHTLMECTEMFAKFKYQISICQLLADMGGSHTNTSPRMICMSGEPRRDERTLSLATL